MVYQPWQDMEEGFWNFLHGKDEYLQLALNEFRTYDGRLLPWDPKDGVWPVELLPAMHLEFNVPLKRVITEGDVEGHPQPGYTNGIECDGLLVFQGPSRAGIEHAAETLRRLMDGRVAVQTHLGSAAIGDYSFEVDEVRAIPMRSAKGIAAFWQAGLQLKLWEPERVALP